VFICPGNGFISHGTRIALRIIDIIDFLISGSERNQNQVVFLVKKIDNYGVSNLWMGIS